MRISTNMIFEQQVRGITDSQASWLKSGQELSSGRRVNNPSDDPIAASRAVVLSQTQQQGKQYALARTFAEQGLSLEENTLKGVTDGIIAAQGLIVNGSTGTLSDDDRGSIATQLEGIRAQLLNQANSQDANGRYIFAGYKSDTAPFTQDASGNVAYSGGDTAISQKVDASRTMTTSHTGSQVFTSLTSNAVAEPDGSASESNIFTTLNTAINSLKQPLANADGATKDAAAADMAKANRGLRNSMNNVLKVQSEVGTQLSELDSIEAKSDDTALSQATQMSNLVDADYTSTISSYTMKQAALQASYKVFSSMSQMSLFKMNS